MERLKPGVLLGTAAGSVVRRVARGPVFKSWADFCFLPEHGAKVGHRHEELKLLTICFDEIVHGRFVECADVLASRLRYVAEVVESGNVESAKEFLIYRRPRKSLTNDDMLQVAHDAALKRLKLVKKAEQVNRAAGR